MSVSDKYLLLIDLNGTLCYRTDTRIENARESSYFNRRFFYARPGINEFISALHDTGMFELAVYSSAMKHNIVAGLDAMLTTPNRTHITHVLDRMMSKPDPAGGEFDTIRDMDKIWNELVGFGPKRTVLLDNERGKFEKGSVGIVVPEFEETEVLAAEEGSLDEIQRLLEDIALICPDDVGDYFRERVRRGRDEGSG